MASNFIIGIIRAILLQTGEFMAPSFKDRIAIVTGGSRGIGKAFAFELAKGGKINFIFA